MKFFICHYQPLKKRYTTQEKQFKKYGIVDKEYILEYDQEVIPDDYLVKFDCSKLKKSEISLFIKHIEAMKKIINSNLDWGIIMEDDALFRNNFDINLNKITSKINSIEGIVYCGFFPFTNFYIRQKMNSKQKVHEIFTVMNKNQNYTDCHDKKILYDMTNTVIFPWTGTNKGTDLYLIDKNTAKIFVNFFNECKNNQINQPIDHFMGTFSQKNNIKSFWTPFTLASHGSLSIFKSSLR